jgi:hypothetical protein
MGISGPIREFGDEGFHELFGGGAGGSELHFQRVYQGQQLIDFDKEGHWAGAASKMAMSATSWPGGLLIAL